MHLVVVTPEGAVVDQEVAEINAPGTAGDLGVLPGHRPLLTSLRIGELSYAVGGKAQFLAVNEGYLSVADDDLIVVTETAEAPDDIDVPRAQRSLEEAQQLLTSADTKAREEAFHQALAKKARAENRIAVAKAHATPAALKKVAAKG